MVSEAGVMSQELIHVNEGEIILLRLTKFYDIFHHRTLLRSQKSSYFMYTFSICCLLKGPTF